MAEYGLMPFPEREWPNIAKQLDETGICSSVRLCDQLGRYAVGEIYATPWGDAVEIVSVKRYLKAEDIPTWSHMDKGMKISVRKGERYGGSRWDYITFKKINRRP